MTAYLQVTMTIDPADRAAGAKVYSDYLQEFLDTVPGAGVNRSRAVPVRGTPAPRSARLLHAQPLVPAAVQHQPGEQPVAGLTGMVAVVRDEDVQVLHGFETAEQASAYLSSELFTTKVVPGLTPLFKADPDIRVYTVA